MISKGTYADVHYHLARKARGKDKGTGRLIACVEEAFDFALSSNKAWASFKAHQNPEFFTTLAKGQAPSIRMAPCLPLQILNRNPRIPTYLRAIY
jgi:hypothetical protein